jgi:hypothetical protein
VGTAGLAVMRIAFTGTDGMLCRRLAESVVGIMAELGRDVPFLPQRGWLRQYEVERETRSFVVERTPLDAVADRGACDDAVLKHAAEHVRLYDRLFYVPFVQPETLSPGARSSRYEDALILGLIHQNGLMAIRLDPGSFDAQIAYVRDVLRRAVTPMSPMSKVNP